MIVPVFILLGFIDVEPKIIKYSDKESNQAEVPPVYGNLWVSFIDKLSRVFIDHLLHDLPEQTQFPEMEDSFLPHLFSLGDLPESSTEETGHKEPWEAG